MAQPLARRPRRAPASSRRSISPTVLVIGGVAALVAIGAVLALSGSSAASPPAPAPGGGTGGAGRACPPNLNPALHVLRLADSGSALTVNAGDTVRTALLLNPPQTGTYHWVVSSSDATILSKTSSTTGPDASSPHGTDYLDSFTATGAGTATLSGQLVPKVGSGPAIGTFTATVTVVCSGASVGGTGPSPAHALKAGQSYVITINAPHAGVIAVPNKGDVQSALVAALGLGQRFLRAPLTVAGVSQPSPNIVVISLTMNLNETITDAMLLSAANVTRSTGYTITIA